MKSFISWTISAGLGLWLVNQFIANASITYYSDSNFFGFQITALWQIYLVLAISIGLLNSFVKPILDTISFPLRIITLGLFGFAINMSLIFAVDYIFREFSAPLIWPLLWTTLVIWILNKIISKIIIKE